jgi:hypothetical protein
MKKFIIITTINHKSEAITRFENRKDWNIVVVGDKKSPFIPSSSNLTFLPVETQLELNFKFAEICPYNHYSRKNIGYLYALRQGADIIYDTDDDNIPYNHWELPGFTCGTCITGGRSRFINVYRHFSDAFIWPRGFPLDEIRNSQKNYYTIEKNQITNIGIWQGLSDGEPDIDAIYRLIIGKKLTFKKREPVYLAKGSLCPINSQNTFWHKDAFPYLYLPAGASFRFTDILRGYIAQILLWRQGLHVGFTGPSVYQERNPHDLMKDFRDEIESYLQIKRVVEIMENLEMKGDPFENLRNAYAALHKGSIVPVDELKYLDAWLEDNENR